MKPISTALPFLLAGLILIGGGIAAGSTERVVTERYSWEDRRTLVIPVGSYSTFQLNGTRTYTYWRTLWHPEQRSTWSYDHRFSWEINVTSGVLGFLEFNERAYNDWSRGSHEYSQLKPRPLGGDYAVNVTPQWRWWVEDPGNPYFVFINNGTTTAVVSVHVVERWPQFKNQNAEFGAVLIGIGITITAIGTFLVLRKRTHAKFLS